MFDIGFSEVFVIAIVALLVLGPERLPKAARFAGLWVRRARAQWYSVKSELENELADEELKRSLRQTQDDLRDAQNSLRASGEAMRREFDEIDRNVTGRPAPTTGENAADEGHVPAAMAVAESPAAETPAPAIGADHAPPRSGEPAVAADASSTGEPRR